MTIIYDEPADVYHANPAIGSSEIRAFLKSPQLFRDMRDKVEQKETAALLFGTNMHTLFLEPDRWRKTVIQKPEKMSFSTKDGKAWREDKEAAGLTIVPFEDFVHLNRMRERMPAEVRRIFDGKRTEVTYRTTIDGIAAQCRFDLHGDSEKSDLKSIDDIDKVEMAIWKYGYYIQRVWYGRVERAETGEKPTPFPLIFAEKKPPYRWRIVTLDADYHALGEAAVNDALHGIKARIKSGCWDDPKPLELLAEPPEWLTTKLAWEQEESDHGPL